jgi:hypothetical protein
MIQASDYNAYISNTRQRADKLMERWSFESKAEAYTARTAVAANGLFPGPVTKHNQYSQSIPQDTHYIDVGYGCTPTEFSELVIQHNSCHICHGQGFHASDCPQCGR